MWLIVRDAQIERRSGVPSLADMQEAVGGYIEGIDIWPRGYGQAGVTAYCNEDGRSLEMAPNVYVPVMEQVIVGPVVISALDEEGGTRAMTEEEVAKVKCGEEYLISFEYGAMIPLLIYQTEPIDTQEKSS